MNSDWHLGANDPDPVGWLVFASYLLVASLCWLCARKAGRSLDRDSSGDSFLWWGLAAVMLLLGINKQLDLQTPFIALGRTLAITEGWYPQRRIVQWVFVGCLGSVGFALLAGIAWYMRHEWSRYALPLCGLALLIIFVLYEAAPLDLLDALGLRIPIPHKRQTMELLGISCVCASAIVTLWRGHGNRGAPS